MCYRRCSIYTRRANNQLSYLSNMRFFNIQSEGVVWRKFEFGYKKEGSYKGQKVQIMAMWLRSWLRDLMAWLRDSMAWLRCQRLFSFLIRISKNKMKIIYVSHAYCQCLLNIYIYILNKKTAIWSSACRIRTLHLWCGPSDQRHKLGAVSWT